MATATTTVKLAARFHPDVLAEAKAAAREEGLDLAPWLRKVAAAAIPATTALKQFLTENPGADCSDVYKLTLEESLRDRLVEAAGRVGLSAYTEFLDLAVRQRLALVDTERPADSARERPAEPGLFDEAPGPVLRVPPAQAPPPEPLPNHLPHPLPSHPAEVEETSEDARELRKALAAMYQAVWDGTDDPVQAVEDIERVRAYLNRIGGLTVAHVEGALAALAALGVVAADPSDRPE